MLSYYPDDKSSVHYPAEIVTRGIREERVQIKYTSQEFPEGKVVWVDRNRLVDNGELF